MVNYPSKFDLNLTKYILMVDSLIFLWSWDVINLVADDDDLELELHLHP